MKSIPSEYVEKVTQYGSDYYLLFGTDPRLKISEVLVYWSEDWAIHTKLYLSLKDNESFRDFLGSFASNRCIASAIITRVSFLSVYMDITVQTGEKLKDVKTSKRIANRILTAVDLRKRYIDNAIEEYNATNPEARK